MCTKPAVSIQEPQPLLPVCISFGKLQASHVHSTEGSKLGERTAKAPKCYGHTRCKSRMCSDDRNGNNNSNKNNNHHHYHHPHRHHHDHNNDDKHNDTDTGSKRRSSRFDCNLLTTPRTVSDTLAHVATLRCVSGSRATRHLRLMARLESSVFNYDRAEIAF